MSKNSFFDTSVNDVQFDRETVLAAELPSSVSEQLQMQTEKHNFIISLIATISSAVLIIVGCVIFFVKDKNIDNPVIDCSIIRISASQLTASIFFVVLGVITMIIGKYKFTIKK